MRNLVVESRLYTAYTDKPDYQLNLDINLDSVPIVVEDTEDDFLFQEKFVQQGVGIMTARGVEGGIGGVAGGPEDEEDARTESAVPDRGALPGGVLETSSPISSKNGGDNYPSTNPVRERYSFTFQFVLFG